MLPGHRLQRCNSFKKYQSCSSQARVCYAGHAVGCVAQLFTDGLISLLQHCKDAPNSAVDDRADNIYHNHNKPVDLIGMPGRRLPIATITANGESHVSQGKR